MALMKTIKTARRITALIGVFLGFQALVSYGTDSKPQSATAPRSSPGVATWYRVPASSLAHRRARPNEFTAAHNRLPIGTLVRVTRISNGHHVIVRITDRGIRDRHATIDVCWEAAERLGMIHAGVARVRLEIIPGTALAVEAGEDWVSLH